MLMNLGFPRKLLQVYRRSWAIKKSRSGHLPARELAAAYRAVERAHLFKQSLGRDPGKHLPIFGWTFHFLDFDAFRFLFKEVFLNEDYFFESETPNPHIIDCGSNVGDTILYFKRLYPECTILGFEPHPPTLEVLKRNLAENRVPGVTVKEVALAGGKTRTSLYAGPSDGGSLQVSLHPTFTADGAPSVVQTGVLSEHIHGNVDFLKIDTEGSELWILSELRDSGKIRNLSKMAIEYHHHVGDHDGLSALLLVLEGAGFGYHVKAGCGVGEYLSPHQQNIMVYAYRKGAGAVDATASLL